MNRLAATLLATLLLLMLPDTARAAPGCVADGARIVAARQKLAQIRVEEMETDLPPGAGRQIEALKDEIRAYVRAEMTCAEAEPDQKALEKRLFDRGGGLAWDQKSTGYGSELGYSVRRLAGLRAMIGIVATIGIECGSDSFLMLYERRSAGWTEVMVRRSAPYKSIGGGWEGLDFAVSPPDEKGDWYVATAATSPWCTSAWMGIGYSLARPGLDPALPRLILGRHGTTYIGNDEPIGLTALPHRFEIRFDGDSLDTDLLVRKHVETFAIDAAGIRRIQPIALHPHDFLDEWLSAPWKQASAWSAPGPVFRQAHERLSALRSASTLITFHPPIRCRDGKTEIMLEPDSGLSWFFLVGGSNPYRLERVANTTFPGCPRA